MIDMPKFCPNCGEEMQFESAKFCPDCGCSLISNKESGRLEGTTAVPIAKSPNNTEIHPDNTNTPNIQNNSAIDSTAFNLGKKLEEIIEQIYQFQGYKTESRKKVQGKGNYKNEIDIIAMRGKEKIAIECKNFSGPVGIQMVRDFAQKMDDLGYDWKGVMIAYNYFTSEAEEFAKNRNIDLFCHEEIKEKWFEISVGRGKKKGDSVTIKNGLRINVDYLPATLLDLKNKEKVAVFESKLIFHPYFRIPYKFRTKVHDPTRKLHELSDEGTVVVDLLDGEVLNSKIVEESRSIVKKFKLVTSADVKNENVKIKSLVNEITGNKPQEKYTLSIDNDFEVTYLEPGFTKRGAQRAALEFIIDRNSRVIRYEVDGGGMLPDIKEKHFVPKRNDIQLFNEEVIIVPKWKITFNCLGNTYKREILAASGNIVEDEIRYCPAHFKLGSMTVKKENIAVCEQCGRAFCEEHIIQCPVSGKWLCQEHSEACGSCHIRFDPDVLQKTCAVCESPLCSDCAVVCPICNAEYGRVHTVTCDQCGQEVCPNCVIVSGLLRKKKLCLNCQREKK